MVSSNATPASARSASLLTKESEVAFKTELAFLRDDWCDEGLARWDIPREAKRMWFVYKEGHTKSNRYAVNLDLCQCVGGCGVATIVGEYACTVPSQVAKQLQDRGIKRAHVWVEYK
jgi:hypothetical protein